MRWMMAEFTDAPRSSPMKWKADWNSWPPLLLLRSTSEAKIASAAASAKPVSVMELSGVQSDTSTTLWPGVIWVTTAFVAALIHCPVASLYSSTMAPPSAWAIRLAICTSSAGGVGPVLPVATRPARLVGNTSPAVSTVTVPYGVEGATAAVWNEPEALAPSSS